MVFSKFCSELMKCVRNCLHLICCHRSQTIKYVSILQNTLIQCLHFIFYILPVSTEVQRVKMTAGLNVNAAYE